MGSLFGGAKPKVQPPAPMPDDQSPQVLEARRQATAATLARGGRSSTMLTGRSGGGAAPTGIDTYSSSKLGGVS